MDYKHKSGAQKRKAKTAKEKSSKKGQQTLDYVGFIKQKKEMVNEARCSKEDSSSHYEIAMEVAAEDEKNIANKETISSSKNLVAESEQDDLPSISADLGSATCNKPVDINVDNKIILSSKNAVIKKEEAVSSYQKAYNFDIGSLNFLYIPVTQIEEVVRRGPEFHPSQFPDDVSGHRFPLGVFNISLKNGEKMERNWLVWSKSLQALFCYPCRLFSKFPAPKRSALALPSGYSSDKSWKKLHDRIPEHENSNNHKTCYVEWRALEMRFQNNSTVDCLLVESIKCEAERWKEILKRILDVILFLAERGLAFRGSNNTIGDPKNGNFLGILELISHYDPILQEHMKTVKESQTLNKRMQVHYLSPTIQNEFIEHCAAHVIRAIVQEREVAKYYAIIVDGTPDSAHVEQTVFILRYVLLDNDCNQYKIQERFLEFADCNKKTGEAIAELILVTLEKHNIPLAECRGQGYDNGSNMSGKYKGVQSHILQHNPLALFSPCACHTLNLCGVQAAESCAEVVTFFGIVQKLYNIFSSSPQRWEILRKNIGCSLHSMSETRWSARVDCVKPFAAHIPGLRQAITDLELLNLSAEIKSDLKGIQAYISSFECVVMASIWIKALTLINYRSTVLQAREATIDVEVENIKTLIDDLQHLRNNWETILRECETVSKNLDIADTFRNKRLKIRKRFIDETQDDMVGSNSEIQFKHNVFYVLLDCLIGNMTRRFQALREIEARFSFLWKYRLLEEEVLNKEAKLFCKYYDADVAEDLLEEISHLRAIHEANLGSTSLPPLKLLNKIIELKMEVLFPNIIIALRIYCTIPVSVAEGERSFSVLARIKNVLRSTMCQDRLTSLGSLALESSLARKLDFNQIISYFANLKARKALIQ